ncbi:MAG: hypothetical protein HY927_13750 [Elusimicrobia bacterium]|nr:hypothetical protein [Elusimicrobiota bacterium]
MSPVLKYFLWMYFRAFLWIASAALCLHRATGRPRVARAYVGAHVVALGVGALADFFLYNFAPKSWLVIEVLQWVFTAPIVVFTVISLWIGSWEVSVEAPDVFMTLVPIAAWGLMVIYGWQDMYDCHVLGAWFVSAASGAVDLWTRFGPPLSRRRSFLARLAGYALVVMAVYLLLPRTELTG